MIEITLVILVGVAGVVAMVIGAYRLGWSVGYEAGHREASDA